MQRINVLLNKISDLSKKAEKIDMIEVDLMLDYTRVLYADLLELKNKKVYNSNSSEGKNVPNHSTEEILDQKAPVHEKKIEEESTIEKPALSVDSEPITYQTTNTTPLPNSNKNIKKFIGINDKYQFISELFDNDTEAYDKVITNINSFNTSLKALEWLDNDVYKDRGWNEDNDSVKMFYDTVSNFFASI